MKLCLCLIVIPSFQTSENASKKYPVLLRPSLIPTTKGTFVDHASLRPGEEAEKKGPLSSPRLISDSGCSTLPPPFFAIPPPFSPVRQQTYVRSGKPWGQMRGRRSFYFFSAFLYWKEEDLIGRGIEEVIRSPFRAMEKEIGCGCAPQIPLKTFFFGRRKKPGLWRNRAEMPSDNYCCSPSLYVYLRVTF